LVHQNIRHVLLAQHNQLVATSSQSVQFSLECIHNGFQLLVQKT